MNQLLIALCMFVSFYAHADEFGSVFTDPANNLSWAKALPGRYSNGCVDQNGNYYSPFCYLKMDPIIGAVMENGYYEIDPWRSNAARACDAIDARLPTRNEYQSFVQQFDHDDRGRLTSRGVAAMQKIFGDIDSKWWWTSTNGYDPLYKDFDRAYGFFVSEDGPEAGMASYDTFRRDELGAVRCVKRDN